MREIKDFLEFDKPLREYYLNLSDEEFRIVMAGLTETELKILKLVYGKEYLVVNDVQLRESEIKLFTKVLKEKIVKDVRKRNKIMIKTRKEKTKILNLLLKMCLIILKNMIKDKF